MDGEAVWFAARGVAFLSAEDVETDILVLAERPEGGDGHTIEIQLSMLEPDEQDIALGMTGHCLVLDKHRTSYGAIERWGVQDDVMALHLSVDAAHTLGVPQLLRVGLLSPAATDAVAEALRYLVDEQGVPPKEVTLIAEADPARPAPPHRRSGRYRRLR